MSKKKKKNKIQTEEVVNSEQGIEALEALSMQSEEDGQKEEGEDILSTVATAADHQENADENWDPLLALTEKIEAQRANEKPSDKPLDFSDYLQENEEESLADFATTEEAFEEVIGNEDLQLELSSEEEEALIADEFINQESDTEEATEEEALLAAEEAAVLEANEELKALTDDEAISIIESLLFISDRPVGLSTFKNAFVGTKVTTKKIKELIAELQGDFAEIRRGVTLEEIDGAYQIRTKVDNQEFIKKIIKAKTFKLTGPSLETLAVIAYKQPCVKSDVDEVRGVESGHLIRALMDKGLVTFAGKSELPGKPMLYKTTRKFLEIFGLRNINELPSLAEMQELLPEGIDAEEDKQTLSDLTADLSENYEGNYSVAEDELGKITEQLAGISTRTEFFEEEKRKQKEKEEREKADSINEALALGEDVEDKDRKWLERYEARLAQEEAEAAAAKAETEAALEEVSAESEVEAAEDELTMAAFMEQKEEDNDEGQGQEDDEEEQESPAVHDPLDLL